MALMNIQHNRMQLTNSMDNGNGVIAMHPATMIELKDNIAFS